MRCSGATLVELLFALALLAILAGAAAPAYQELIAHQQLRAAVNDLCGAIDLTRSQAIARGGRVLLAPLEPGGADWRMGWVVFVDRNGDRRPNSGDETIFQQGPVADGIRIDSAFSSGAAPLYLAYNGAGRSCAAGNSLAARWGTLSLVQGKQTRKVIINMLGRLRVCDPQLHPATCASAAE
ncbi:GspH/FimT family protein [Rugamonas sp. CCM 8940]|uniref:GspH/FimT family protein n=1 Tax=Rugamonas sp. CCM 8940 TaxID=2765359 RepID=UPI0018F2F6C1|nr:GspH/FimT family protein [Rugamonas sp. CCM 8940]MBJ7308823.1 GspH/FimT family protein [Rugamonas sp. CCM 8940]